jgi:hypothetical protein
MSLGEQVERAVAWQLSTAWGNVEIWLMFVSAMVCLIFALLWIVFIAVRHT